MSLERRRFQRTGVSWRGRATLADGPQVPIQILDVSAGGAKVLLPAGTAPERRELLDMTIFRRRFWPFQSPKPVNALGRVVRVTAEQDGQSVTAGVRFHTPLQRIRRRLKMPWLSMSMPATNALGALAGA